MARRPGSAPPLAAAAAALAAAAAMVPLAGCGKDDRPVPAACTRGPDAIAAALRRAPAPVRLPDGTPLSTCVERARSDADLQNIGALYTRVADSLATQAPRSDGAALQLGYLVGATRRGAAHTNGIHLELQRRLEQAIGIGGAPRARRAAYDRGLAAGARAG